METASRQLLAVVKDHNSQPIIDTIKLWANGVRSRQLRECACIELSSTLSNMSMPCAHVNCGEFDAPLQEATMKLKADSMTIVIESSLIAQIGGARLSSTIDEL